MLMDMWYTMFALLALSTNQAEVSPAGSAKVVADEAALHEKASSSSRVVRALKKDEIVIVEIRIDGSEGQWCAIRFQDKEQASGYVLCSQLLDLSASAEKATTYRAVKEPAPASPENKAGGQKPGPAAASLASGEFWTEALAFDRGQRQQAQGLLRGSGVSGCRERLGSLLIDAGISDGNSLAKWLVAPKDIPHRQQENGIGAAMQPCIRSYQSFWAGFDRLLTPAQRGQAQADARYRLLQSTLPSDPETLIFGDVMYSMRRERPAERLR